MIVLEQYVEDMRELQVISKEHGMGYGVSLVLVGSQQFTDLMKRADVVNITCNSGFGSYTLRKRERGGHFYWFGYRRVGEEVREFSAGKSEDITSELLDEVAIKLYQ